MVVSFSSAKVQTILHNGNTLKKVNLPIFRVFRRKCLPKTISPYSLRPHMVLKKGYLRAFCLLICHLKS